MSEILQDGFADELLKRDAEITRLISRKDILEKQIITAMPFEKIAKEQAEEITRLKARVEELEQVKFIVEDNSSGFSVVALIPTVSRTIHMLTPNKESAESYRSTLEKEYAEGGIYKHG